MTCPRCQHPGYFGPAAIIDENNTEHLYVTCKRCGENYVVERGGTTVREALTELLTENPGSVVSCAMVYKRLGRVVSRNAVSKVAGSLGRSMCVGIPGGSGGYRSRVTS